MSRQTTDRITDLTTSAPMTLTPAGVTDERTWAVVTRQVVLLVRRRWVVRVIGALSTGPKRHFQLARLGPAPKVLTETLDHLSTVGLVEVTLIDDPRPTAAYSLTPDGYAVFDLLGRLHEWATEHPHLIARESTSP